MVFLQLKPQPTLLGILASARRIIVPFVTHTHTQFVWVRDHAHTLVRSTRMVLTSVSHGTAEVPGATI